MLSSNIMLSTVFPGRLRENKNFENYIRYSNALKRLLQVSSLKQWINGSFVTQVPDPGDIDFVTFIDHSMVRDAGASLDAFSSKNAFTTFGVDAYIVETFPPAHPSYFFYESDSLYWISCFERTRRDHKGRKHPKGFLEIIY